MEGEKTKIPVSTQVMLSHLNRGLAGSEYDRLATALEQTESIKGFQVEQFFPAAKIYFPKRPKVNTAKKLKACAERTINAYLWRGAYEARVIALSTAKSGIQTLKFLSEDGRNTIATVPAKSIVTTIKLDNPRIIWSDFSTLKEYRYPALSLLKQVMNKEEMLYWAPLFAAKLDAAAVIQADVLVGLWLKHFPHDCALPVNIGHGVEEIFVFQSEDLEWDLEPVMAEMCNGFIDKSLHYIETGEHFEDQNAIKVLADNPHICSGCGKKSVKKLSRCARCKKASYCSRECQTIDWKVHQNFCIAK